MIKKLISSILAVAMVASMSTTVFASETKNANEIIVQDEIGRAIAGISDVPITDEMAEAIVATYADETGKTVELDVKTTIRCLGKTSRSTSEPLTYAITAYVSGDLKNVSDSGTCNNDNILASGSFTMVWTDGKGVDTFNNIIETLYGNWSKSTNDNTTLTNGTIRWGAIGNMQAGSKTVMRSFGSFNENIGYKNNTLSAESNAYLEKNLNGTVEKGEISIGVTASIFA